MKSVIFATVLICSGRQLEAQKLTVPTASFSSSTDSIRVRAFYGLVSTATQAEDRQPGGGLRPRVDLLAQRATQQPELASALTSLLSKENALVAQHRPDEPHEQEMLDYRLAVVGTVARLQDPNTIPLLLPWIANGGAAEDAIVAFGPASVPDLLRLLEDQDRYRRWGAVRSIQRVLQTPGLNTNSDLLLRTKVSLLGALKRQDDWVLRRRAIAALTSFSGADVRAEMQRLAQEDPATLPGRGTGVRYPVRDAAREWLSRHP